MNKIIVSGFGGQGVLSLGKFLAQTAMDSGLEVSWLPSYGPEMRGGTANCSVVIDSEPIASPVISKPNLLVAMNLPSVTKFAPTVEKGGVVIYDRSAAGDLSGYGFPEGVKAFGADVDAVAEKINPRGANVVMLGAVLRFLSGLSLEVAAEAVKKAFKAKPKLIDVNLECLKLGYELTLEG